MKAGQRIAAVVIGASAGGIEALSTLLPALPSGTCAAVIVVLHLPRDRRSLLVDIFKPRCALPVSEANDKEPVAGGHIYFAPPDYHLLVDEGPRFALSIDTPVHYSRPSIDVLFESAADCYGEHLMGIVLTGGNQDGAAGLAQVQQRGGLTVVQDPANAQVPYMPESALARIVPDHVLPLADIAGLLRTQWQEVMR